MVRVALGKGRKLMARNVKARRVGRRPEVVILDLIGESVS